MKQFTTMLDALLYAHEKQGGTIHQYSRQYGVDMLKAKPPFLVRTNKLGKDVLCTVNGKNAVVPIKSGKNYHYGETLYQAMRESFQAK